MFMTDSLILRSTSILYYCKGKPHLKDIIDRIALFALEIIDRDCPFEYAESFYLFFDLISYPDIDVTVKSKIVDIATAKLQGTHNNAAIIKYIADNSWYSNWSHGKSIIKRLLKKKELMLSY